MDNVDADIRTISELSDNNEEFRTAIIKWILGYCKDEKRRWGHIKLAKALVKNAYPNLTDNKPRLEDEASPFYETLRSLLYRNKNAPDNVVTLSKNRHLYDLICLFVFHQDFDFFKYQLYGKRIENVAQSFLTVTRGLNSPQLHKLRRGWSESMPGLFEDMKASGIFWEIKYWNQQYLQLFKITEKAGQQGTYYEIDLGVLIQQDLGHICLVYSEHSRIISIYLLKGLSFGSGFATHPDMPDFTVRSLLDGSSISFKQSENKTINKIAEIMELPNGRY